ncbi:catalase CatB [Aeromicrobium halocynthiae]|uniref:Catalase n=1 Tax=Aeromicrobium halocynthiae TaxID=560557 RepID=A0ABN2W2P4_9ACTN
MTVRKKLQETAAKAVESVQDALTPDTPPGRPGPVPPPLEEPTEPHDPLPRKPDQQAPDARSATGGPSDDRAQQGAYVTTAQGVRVSSTDHSLRAGARGPTLLQDHHLREKVMHFDHERIPERVVHARGAAAHGTFVANGAASSVTSAGFLAEGVETPVFVRFSTVLGSRGSADTVRDTRGFATKFYTADGTFDLVGNNIPVFFIQDGIKFPDVIHAGKPHPDREIPQAQSAHDTFWDFVSLHTEATHHTIWNMSDRGIPRSYRMMEGFGVHTFRLVAADGTTTLVKFHWKPRLGVHSLTWEEAQMAAGVDPDFHRRDLADAIESGAHPQWDLGIQTFPDTPEQTFEGIDLLDPTKIVPEELAPVQPIGTLTLTHNPTNYFAETEQVAFHTGHLVPGIDITDDPLLAARNFSYLDTQLTRLGGPNFAQIPINRPHAPVNDMQRDGFHQHAVHEGVAPYRPNTLDGGCPFIAGEDVSRYVEAPVTVPEAAKVRADPTSPTAAISFDDHYTQPRQFYLSMTPVERTHIAQAYTFELGKCYEQAIKERALRTLANIDTDLCLTVANGLGLEPPTTGALEQPEPSPALSQVGGAWPVDGRLVGILVDSGGSLEGVRAARDAVADAGMVPLVVSDRGGVLDDGDGEPMAVQRTYTTVRSIELDAVLVAGPLPPGPDAVQALDAEAGAPPPADGAGTGPQAQRLDPRMALLLGEMHRHAKAIGGWGQAEAVLAAAGLNPSGAGVVIGDDGAQSVDTLIGVLAGHRVWERFPPPAL